MAFAYFRGLPLASAPSQTVWFLEPRVAYASPNEDGLTVVTCAPSEELRPAFRSDGVGLGWYLRQADGVQLVGHDGFVVGQQSTLLLVPAHALALVVLTNSDRGVEVAYEAATWALQTFLGLSRPPTFERFLGVLRRMVGAS